MELKKLIDSLRYRLIEFRIKERNNAISYHINAIEIAIGLVGYALETKPSRSIEKEEERWFEAGHYLDLLLGNTEW